MWLALANRILIDRIQAGVESICLKAFTWLGLASLTSTSTMKKLTGPGEGGETHKTNPPRWGQLNPASCRHMNEYSQEQQNAQPSPVTPCQIQLPLANPQIHASKSCCFKPLSLGWCVTQQFCGNSWPIYPPYPVPAWSRNWVVFLFLILQLRNLQKTEYGFYAQWRKTFWWNN